MTFGNFAVFGDSYSTFEGYIPENYLIWYGPTRNEQNGVLRVEQTWWYPIATAEGNHLVFNNSYSGSTICNTGYESRYCPDSSFVGRMKAFSGHGEDLDTVFLLAGTNDTWANSPIGEPTDKAWDEYTDDELRTVLPATYCLLGYLRATLPKTRIVILINDYLKDPIKEALHRGGEEYRCDVIDLPDISRLGGHPTADGMREIREAIFAYYENRKM